MKNTKKHKKIKKPKNNTKNINWIKKYKMLIFVSVFTLLGGLLVYIALAGTVFSDNFDSYNEGLVTSEYTYWNPNATDTRVNNNWDITSGAVFATRLNGSNVAYTGVPTYETRIGANPTINSGNNSAVFRMVSKPNNFRDSEVSFDLNVRQLTSTAGTPQVNWDGVHVFLRYQSPYNLYYASVNRRDGSLAIKKKVPGGPSNGGTYYTLASTSANRRPIPFNTWQSVKVSIITNPNSSVTIKIMDGNNNDLLTAIDNGSIGGAPILNPGRVGIRGDNTEFYFDNFIVNDPNVDSQPSVPETSQPIPTPEPEPALDNTPPQIVLSSPANGSTVSGTIRLVANATDNIRVAKVEFYNGSNQIGASTRSPFEINWDTTQMSNGTQAINSIAYDDAENSKVSNTVSVNVTNVSPSANDTISPTVTIDRPANNFATNKNVSVAARAQDNIGVVRMYLYLNGKQIATSTGDTLNYNAQLKNSGFNTLMVTAIDAEGNIGRNSVIVFKNYLNK